MQETEVNGYTVKGTEQGDDIKITVTAPNGNEMVVAYWSKAMQAPTGAVVNDTHRAVVSALSLVT